MSVVTEPTLSQEQQAARDALKSSLGSGYRRARKAMASVATAIVDLRMTFSKEDGKPDYRGETPEYREAVSQVYEEIITDEADRAAFKQAIRYWISKEFQVRVSSGALDASELADSGISRPSRKAAATSSNGSSAKAQKQEVSEAVHKHNGVVQTAKGKPLTPKEVFKAAEGVAAEYLADIGPVTLIRSVTSELKALMEAIDSPDAGINPEVSVFRGAVKNLVAVTLALAEKSKVEVPGMATSEPEPVQRASEQQAQGRLTPRRGRPPKKQQQEEETRELVAPHGGINWPS